MWRRLLGGWLGAAGWMAVLSATAATAATAASAASAAKAANAANARDGAASFATNCALCHQADAGGLPGKFPRLAGRVAAIGARNEGRIYLADVLTYGMVGPIEVDGARIVGVMPAFAALPAATIADILNYLQSLDGAPAADAARESGAARPSAARPFVARPSAARPFTEKEIAASRALAGKSLASVKEERRALQDSKVIE